jgi:F-type H+-transporting ATPase subunit delta
MQAITAARPYAQAVYGLAKEQDALTSWSDVLALLNLIVSDANVRLLIKDPRVSKEQIATLIHEVAGGGLDEQAKNLVSLLAERERLGLVPEIARLYEQHRADEEGTVDVEVVSAYALEPAQEQNIAAAVQRRIGKEVNLNTRIDESLIGGAVIRMGDSVIDLSLRGRLTALRSTVN